MNFSALFFRDDSVARTKGEPIAMFTFLPDVAGWQASNPAGLTEDRIGRVV